MDSDSVAMLQSKAPMPRHKRWRGSLVALLLLVGLVWLAWSLTHQSVTGHKAGGPGGGAGGGRPAATVGVALAKQADIPIILEALGAVKPLATVQIQPQVSGVLQQVLFKEGQTVNKGEVLATINPRQFELALMQASGQRARDEAQLQAARTTLERYNTLLEQDSIARQEVDTQAALVKQLEGSVIVDRANEGSAKLNLSYTRITAPISGRIGLRTVDAGNLVGSSTASGAGLAVITQMSPADVEFSVPQDQAAELLKNIATGMTVTALDRTRTTVLDEGKFTSLDNQVDAQTGTVRAKARFPNAKSSLFPNQFVNVKVLIRTIKNAIVVPVAALRQNDAGSYVYVLNADKKVALRPVVPGRSTVDQVQIVSGLKVGEQVIIEGADRLKDGASVTLPEDAAASAGNKRRRHEVGPE